jgi:hypothetical protein
VKDSNNTDDLHQDRLLEVYPTTDDTTARQHTSHRVVTTPLRHVLALDNPVNEKGLSK